MTDKEKALKALERLANTRMDIPLKEWCDIHAAILAALQGGTTRPGYVVVPVEPSYEMQNAGKWAAFDCCDGDEDLEDAAPGNDECALIYKAMIKAAQEEAKQ